MPADGPDVLVVDGLNSIEPSGQARAYARFLRAASSGALRAFLQRSRSCFVASTAPFTFLMACSACQVEPLIAAPLATRKSQCHSGTDYRASSRPYQDSPERQTFNKSLVASNRLTKSCPQRHIFK